MSVLTREQLLQKINTILGDNSTTDDGLSLIEDVTDTYNDLTSKTGTDWEKKYNENDKAWREKYRARFMSGGSSNDDDNSPTDDKNTPLDEGEEKKELEALTYDKLFTTEKSNDDKKEE